jgi:hypothetical protein
VKRSFEQSIFVFSLLAPLACGGSGKPAAARSEGNPLLPAAQAAPSVLTASGADALAVALAASVQQSDAPGIVGLVVSRDAVLFQGTAGDLSDATSTAALSCSSRAR